MFIAVPPARESMTEVFMTVVTRYATELQDYLKRSVVRSKILCRSACPFRAPGPSRGSGMDSALANTAVVG
jgi:hypothetical protein